MYLTKLFTFNNSDEFYYNRQGAKCFTDESRHDLLDIPIVNDSNKCGKVYKVLSVGCNLDGSSPLITILEGRSKRVYRLPDSHCQWVYSQVLSSICLGINKIGLNIEFGVKNDTHYLKLV